MGEARSVSGAACSHSRRLSPTGPASRVQEIFAENELYCEKLGMKLGTENHSRCLLALGEFRMNVEKRMRDESGSFWQFTTGAVLLNDFAALQRSNKVNSIALAVL
jgi:hypothetical protein